MSGIGFNSEKYVKEQTRAILKRAEKFGDKLYLEFGGKIVYDFHASRVLPGFKADVKMQLLENLAGDAEIIICIFAGDIEKRKVRADFGITYDSDILRMIDELRSRGLGIAGVVITRYEGQAAANIFKKKLERRGTRVYTHKFTKGYPTDVDLVVSEEGYGANEFIETTKPLVVVTGPGPGSGKLATSLSQLYHERKRGLAAGYAKFETFPVWNLPLKHPVNVAYESATAELKDYNMIDPFHLEAYGQTAVSYNRDVEAFPLLQRIIRKIDKDGTDYRSPTDMGVNRVGFSISDDAAVREAASQEIIRRYFRYSCEYALGLVDRDTVERSRLILQEIGREPEDRPVVVPARTAMTQARETGKGRDGTFCGAAIKLKDGEIVTGKNSNMLHASSSLLLNAVKHLADIPDKIHILSPATIDAIAGMKKELNGGGNVSLDVEETLIALSVSAAGNPTTQLAMEKLKDLKGCDVHITHMPTPGDEVGLRKLGVNLTSDPDFASRDLFIT